MTAKGPSPVDLDPAVPSTSRRGLFGAAGAAGLLGAAAVLLSEGSATAAPATTAPSAATPTDMALLGQAQQLELTARDLYQVALDAGVADPDEAISVIRSNHRAYAEAIAGVTGLSAQLRNEEVFASLESRFDSTDTVEVAEAGRELEDIAVATHTALMGELESTSALNLTASILVVEARHATVLGDIAGEDLASLPESEGEAVVITAEVSS